MPSALIGAMPPSDLVGGTRSSVLLSLRFPPRGPGAFRSCIVLPAPARISRGRVDRSALCAWSRRAGCGESRSIDARRPQVIRDRNALSVLASRRRSATGGLHVFIAVEGTEQTTVDPGVVEAGTRRTRRTPYAVALYGLLPAGRGADAASGRTTARRARALARVRHQPVILSTNLDVAAAVDAALDSERNRELLYRPGLRVVRATLFLQPSDEEAARPPRAADDSRLQRGADRLHGREPRRRVRRPPRAFPTALPVVHVLAGPPVPAPQIRRRTRRRCPRLHRVGRARRRGRRVPCARPTSSRAGSRIS